MKKYFSKRIENKVKASRSRKSPLTSVFGEGCCVTKLTTAERSGVLYDGFVKMGVHILLYYVYSSVHGSLIVGL